jgi:hypothetical protein
MNDEHCWRSLKHATWLTYCVKCGLVELSNPISQWCARQTCRYAARPEYQRWLKTGVLP